MFGQDLYHVNKTEPNLKAKLVIRDFLSNLLESIILKLRAALFIELVRLQSFRTN